MTNATTLSTHRYDHLRTNAAAQRQATVDRMKQAIEQLQADKRPITTFTIKEVSSMDYMTYYRNPEALALFRQHSTHLRQEREKEQAKRRRSKRKSPNQHDESLHQVPVQPRDRLLAYKKPELIAKLQAAYVERDLLRQRSQKEREELEHRYHALLQEHMQCGRTIARLDVLMRALITGTKARCCVKLNPEITASLPIKGNYRQVFASCLGLLHNMNEACFPPFVCFIR